MIRLIFKLGKSPADNRENQIVVEQPSPDSVWYLVVEPTKAVPLVNLKNPKNAREVLDALLKQNGEGSVAQYIMNGYSKGKYKEVKQ